MSRHTLRGLTAGCLLSLALGACAAGGPTGLDAGRAPADPAQDHTHHHGGDQTAAPAPARKVTGPTGQTTPAPKPKPKPTPTPAPKPKPTPPRTVRFASPEGAMRYLAAAYNRHDAAALRHVTNPVARESLDAMRPMAENLRLVGCERNAERGDYLCALTHDYPASAHMKGRGSAHFTAAPADRVGWYMTVLNDCS